MRALPPTLLLVAACGTGLEGLGDPDTDTDTQAGPVQVHDIDPWWGPTAGGTVVTIVGDGFSGVVTVTLGDTPAQTFREDATTLLVTTPPAPAEGPVDVLVESAEGSHTVREGFWYSDSGMPDIGGDTDTDTDVVATGQVGGLVELSLLQIACPECFFLTTDLQVAAAAAFHEPISASWSGWLPPSGSCTLNPSTAPPATTRLDVGEWVYLETGSTSLPLHRMTGEGGIMYDGGTLAEPDYRRNATWDVNVPDGGRFGPFVVAGGLESTEGFTALQPVEMLYTQPEAAFAAAISQFGQTISWAPAGAANGMLVLVDVYDETGSTYLGQVACHGPDSGQLVIPGTLLASFPSYALVAIGVYRYHRTETILPTNGATLEAISRFGVLGTGTLVPW